MTTPAEAATESHRIRGATGNEFAPPISLPIHLALRHTGNKRGVYVSGLHHWIHHRHKGFWEPPGTSLGFYLSSIIITKGQKITGNEFDQSSFNIHNKSVRNHQERV